MGNSNFRLTTLDGYIINQLIPVLLFSIFICTLVCELVGISFEQIKFVATEGLPVDITVLVHLLKLPAFICQALPLALLITTIIVYGKLSTRNEVIALQSFGISFYRLIAPAIALALGIAISMFTLQELVVPDANYQAAMVLEQEWQVDRTQLAKYNKREIIYQQFDFNRDRRNLEFLFFADRFNNSQMQNIILLRYQDRMLQEIVTAKTASWNESTQEWHLEDVRRDLLNKDGSYAQVKDVEQLSIKLTKNILDYANHHRDLREMNILELYRRLNIIKNTNDHKKMRQLEIGIQERYALPFSCVVFCFLGSVLGTTKFTGKSNSLGIAASAIIIYYFVQVIATSLTLAEVLSVPLGVWFPNLICALIGFTQLRR